MNLKKMRNSVGGIMIAALFTVTSAQAQNLFWDANGATSGTGGTGTWNTSSSLWRLDSATGALQTYNNTAGSMTANFGGSTGTVTIASGLTINANLLQFTTNSYVIAGADGTSFLNLDGTTPTINTNLTSTNTATISAIITGTTGLTKTGAGILSLSGANTYTGGTTVNEGILSVASTGRLGDNVVGNNVVVNGGANLNLAAASGIGSNQTLTLASTSSAMAGVGVAFNALPAFTQSGADPVLVAINTTGYNAITSQAAVGNGNIFMGSTGSGTFSGASLGAGTGATYRLGGGGGTLTVTNGVLAGGNNLVIGSSSTNGGGTVILSGSNSYTGTTTVSGGNLRAADGVGLGAGNLVLNGGVYQVATTDFTRSLGSGDNQVRITGGTTGFGATNGQTRIVALGGIGTEAALVWGSTHFNPTVFVLNNNTFAGSIVDFRNDIDLNGAARTINNTSTAYLRGDITGSGGLAKTGGGTLTLSGNNTFTGGFTWDDPTTYTLILGSNTALGADLVTLNSSTGAVTVRAEDATARVLANDIVINENDLTFGSSTTGNLTFGDFSKGTGAQVIAVSNAQTTFASYTATGGTFDKNGTGSMLIAGDFTRTGNTTFRVNNGALAVAGVWNVGAAARLGGTSTTGHLGRNGTLSAALGAAQGVTWTGSTASGGLFAYGANATWGHADNNLTVNFGGAGAELTWGTTTGFVQTGQTLYLGHTLSNGTVDFENALNLGAGVRTVQVDQGESNLSGGADAEISGVISNGGLTKTGTGTLLLSGINTYAGDTVVSAGSLHLDDGAQLAFVIGASGVNNWITGSGALLLDGFFTFDLSGAAAVGSWDIVDIDGLTETFGSSFSINGFTETSSGVWQFNDYIFTESTGMLTTVPEPSTYLMFGGGLTVLFLLRKKRESA